MKQQIKVFNYDKNGALIEDLNKVSVPREILNNIANILNMEARSCCGQRCCLGNDGDR
jgi:hypothetical protein